MEYLNKFKSEIMGMLSYWNIKYNSDVDWREMKYISDLTARDRAFQDMEFVARTLNSKIDQIKAGDVSEIIVDNTDYVIYLQASEDECSDCYKMSIDSDHPHKITVLVWFERFIEDLYEDPGELHDFDEIQDAIDFVMSDFADSLAQQLILFSPTVGNKADYLCEVAKVVAKA